MIIVEYLANILILTGTIICLIGSIGLIKLPDFYTRLHAAGVIDSLGTVLIILGVAFKHGFSIFSLKIILLGIFAFITIPTNTHALAKAAFIGGLKPEGKEEL
ncbi:MAG: monovalent cation/H(+) antiporter subunit G [Sphingobacteriia bacterium]|nr:monovalent cation/H(+) antiporter subunit G [Sphingobacteriia bacterium]